MRATRSPGRARPDKVAVITGGSRGIGRAIAAELLSDGYSLALIARHATPLRSATAQLRALSTGVAIRGYSADVASWDSMRRVFGQIVDSFGRIDALVNAAGINIRKPLEKTTPAEWNRVLATNLTGPFIASKLAAGVMIRQRGGAIQYLSSMQARVGSTSLHYSASKAGLHGLSFALARGLAPYHIRVNAIAPGATDTDMSKLWSKETRRALASAALLRRLARPEEVTSAPAFLISDQARFITGAVLDVNGGAWMGG